MAYAAEIPACSACRPGWLRRNIHLLVACVLLAAATGWWLFASTFLKLALEKEAVAWPAGVQINKSDHRLLSLAANLDPYVRHGAADPPMRQDDLETLGVHTGWDAQRFDRRCSNWYLTRLYRDQRVADPSQPYALWQLHLVYYTGAMDTVPHTPDVCLIQAGSQILGTSLVPFHTPAARGPWDQELKVNRTSYRVVRPGDPVAKSYVQYYLFSLNGRPEHDWKIVRAELAKPWVRRCYFAKIMVVPMNPVYDQAEADRKAEEFFNVILPQVLASLPTRSDVQQGGSSNTQ